MKIILRIFELWLLANLAHPRNLLLTMLKMTWTLKVIFKEDIILWRLFWEFLSFRLLANLAHPRNLLPLTYMYTYDSRDVVFLIIFSDRECQFRPKLLLEWRKRHRFVRSISPLSSQLWYFKFRWEIKILEWVFKNS